MRRLYWVLLLAGACDRQSSPAGPHSPNRPRAEAPAVAHADAGVEEDETIVPPPNKPGYAPLE
ncbi:MAG: hypothetical protein IPI67_03240 [Myxococcales bacterium]|nr:hypothetical protein [Myxococcales bacterium]